MRIKTSARVEEGPADASARLLLITSLYPTADRPDVGTFVATRVEAARRRGERITVLAPASYRGSTMRRYLRLALRAMQVPHGVDGVETHLLFPTGVIGAVVARRHGVPHVVYAHGSDVAVSARRSWIHRRIARLVARTAAAVIVNSPHTAGIVRDLGVEPVVISPGVDLAVFHPGSRDLARRRVGLPIDGLIALFVGRLAEDKGADLFGSVLAAAPGWLGVMVGTGPLASSIRARDPDVIQRGWVPSEGLPDWLRSADVLVVPSRHEGLGLAAIEALACGTPVVASSVGGLAATVRHGRTGLLVAPGDPGAMAAALRVLADAGYRATLAAAAPDSVTEHALEHSIDELDKVWRDLGVSMAPEPTG